MFVSGSPGLAQAANALELTRDHLKSLRDSNFHWLLGCTFAVGVGLLLELPEIVHDMCEIYGRKSRELKYWLTPSIDRKEYPRRDWVKKWSALGWVLIVVGVMGEGWFEAQVSKYDSALSNLTDTVVAEAQKESANAEATAKGFDAKIAESDAKAKSAEATARGFEAQIADANARAAEAERETARLTRKLADRVLSPEQQKRIKAKVALFPGVPYELAVSDVPETTRLAESVTHILDSAGWVCKPSEIKTLRFVVTFSNGCKAEIFHGSGVEVGITKSLMAKYDVAAGEIQRALSAEGIEVAGRRLADDDPSPNAIHITIGSKP
jgi:hypothetical protein